MTNNRLYQPLFNPIVIFLFFALTGCAGGQRAQPVWINPGVSDQGRQFQIDKGECLALAAQAVPAVRGAPIVLPQQPQQTQGYTSTYQGWSSSGGSFQGQIETRPSNQAWQPQGFLGGMEYSRQQRAQEDALATQLAPYAMQVRAQQEYAMACMLKRGWQQQQPQQPQQGTGNWVSCFSGGQRIWTWDSNCD